LCTEAKRAAERRFLLDKNNKGLSFEELQMRVQALGFELRALSRDAETAAITPVIEGPRSSTASAARVLPPEMPVEARRKNTIPQVAAPAWKVPTRVFSVPQPTRVAPRASDPVKQQIAPQPNFSAEARAVRTVVTPIGELPIASPVAVEKTTAPIRAPSVAPVLRAEAAGTRTMLAASIVDQGKTADAPKRTQTIAAPMAFPQHIESTRTAPFCASVKVASIPFSAQPLTRIAQPILAAQTPIRSCVQVRRNAPEVMAETAHATDKTFEGGREANEAFAGELRERELSSD
jgi:hypothetical protein